MPCWTSVTTGSSGRHRATRRGPTHWPVWSPYSANPPRPDSPLRWTLSSPRGPSWRPPPRAQPHGPSYASEVWRWRTSSTSSPPTSTRSVRTWSPVCRSWWGTSTSFPERLATYNTQIVAAEADGTTAPDLRDARARALDELAGLLPVHSTLREDGSMGVASSSFNIVDGAQSVPLQLSTVGGTIGLEIVGRSGTASRPGWSGDGPLERAERRIARRRSAPGRSGCRPWSQE